MGKSINHETMIWGNNAERIPIVVRVEPMVDLTKTLDNVKLVSTESVSAAAHNRNS